MGVCAVCCLKHGAFRLKTDGFQRFKSNFGLQIPCEKSALRAFSDLRGNGLCAFNQHVKRHVRMRADVVSIDQPGFGCDVCFKCERAKR